MRSPPGAGWVRWRRSITVGAHARVGPGPPLDSHPRGHGPSRYRSRRGPRGGHRHRGRQPASLSRQALPGAGRHRSRRRAPGRSPRLARSLRARPRAGRSRHREDLPRRRQRPRIPQAPARLRGGVDLRHRHRRAVPRGHRARPRRAAEDLHRRRSGQVAPEGRLVAPPALPRAGDLRAQRRGPPHSPPRPAHRGARRARPARLARGGVRGARRPERPAAGGGSRRLSRAQGHARISTAAGSRCSASSSASGSASPSTWTGPPS